MKKSYKNSVGNDNISSSVYNFFVLRSKIRLMSKPYGENYESQNSRRHCRIACENSAARLGR